MNDLYKSLLCLMACSLSLLSAADDYQISLTLSQTEVQPGDLFELRVKMNSTNYAEFVFSMPSHRQLRQVAAEPGLVQLIDGKYQQEYLYLLQAVSSGDVIIKDAQALVKQTGHEEVHLLPPVCLRVMLYPDVDATNEPSNMPGFESQRENEESFWFWCILIFVVALVVYFRKLPLQLVHLLEREWRR